jgi:hypothetical protein
MTDAFYWAAFAVSLTIPAVLLASQPEPPTPRHRMAEPPWHTRAALNLRMLSAALVTAQILRYHLAIQGAAS